MADGDRNKRQLTHARTHTHIHTHMRYTLRLTLYISMTSVLILPNSRVTFKTRSLILATTGGMSVNCPVNCNMFLPVPRKSLTVSGKFCISFFKSFMIEKEFEPLDMASRNVFMIALTLTMMPSTNALYNSAILFIRS